MTKSQDVPVDSDPPPSFMASEWEAQECSVPSLLACAWGSVARREDLARQVICRNDGTARSPLEFQSVFFLFACLFVFSHSWLNLPWRSNTWAIQWRKWSFQVRSNEFFFSNQIVSGIWGPSPRTSAETRHKLTTVKSTRSLFLEQRTLAAFTPLILIKNNYQNMWRPCVF